MAKKNPDDEKKMPGLDAGDLKLLTTYGARLLCPTPRASPPT
jgi:hypothetical protein